MGDCPANELLTLDTPSNTTDIENCSSCTSPETSEHIERLKFISYGVVSIVIIALGIVGNLTNLVVLTRPNLKGVTFVYLTWLAISDLSTLLVSISSMLRLHGIQSRSYTAAVYYAHIEMPLVNALMASSVFLVVALTIDRYFSVCLPTRFKEVHNAERARRSIATAYIMAFILYIPVCFQKKPVEVKLNDAGQPSVSDFLACENVGLTSHTIFKAYLMVKEVIVRLGPVVLLAVLNTAIIVMFRRTVKKRRALLKLSVSKDSCQQTRDSNRKYREEQRLVVLLAGIVVLFFVSMTPAALLTLLISDDKEQHFGFQLFRAMANILELSNYAMNFYVYCMCSPEIRRTFVALATCKKSVQQSSSAYSKPSSDSSKY